VELTLLFERRVKLGEEVEMRERVVLGERVALGEMVMKEVMVLWTRWRVRFGARVVLRRVMVEGRDMVEVRFRWVVTTVVRVVVSSAETVDVAGSDGEFDSVGIEINLV
jgi:hypothetical protein